jgi:hypothetical protein
MHFQVYDESAVLGSVSGTGVQTCEDLFPNMRRDRALGHREFVLMRLNERVRASAMKPTQLSCGCMLL